MATEGEPPIHRVFAGFVLAPISVGGVLGLMASLAFQNWAGIYYGLGAVIIGCVLSWIIGVPTYLYFRTRMKLTALKSVGFGIGLGGGPFVAAALACAFSFDPLGAQQSIPGLLGAAGLGAICGAAGGAIFWFIAPWSQRRPLERAPF